MGKKETYYPIAEELYVVGGLSYEAIAAHLGEDGPSVNSLSNWAQDGEWKRLRMEWVKGQADLKQDSLRLKQKLVKRALDILGEEKSGPQELYAATAIAARLGQKETMIKASAGPEQDLDRPALFLEDLEFIANILNEIDPEGLKVLARNFETIIARGKAQYAQTA
jgi:hypothetical protein